MSTAISHDLTLGRVLLTLPQPAANPQLHQWQRRVTDTLERISLYPAIPPQAIVIVRQFDDPLPGGLLSDRLRPWEQAAQARLEDCWRGAVRPSQGSVPTSANAVWFTDQAEWLACLSWDIHQGMAHERWWWQSWLQRRSYNSAGDRLFQLWKEDIQWLPQTLTLLKQRHGSGVQSVLAHFNSFQAEWLSQWVAQAYRLPDESTSLAVIHNLKRSLPRSTQRIIQDLPESVQALSVLCFAIASAPLSIQYYRQRQWSATEANESPVGVELPLRAEDSPEPDNAPGISEQDFPGEFGASILDDVPGTRHPPRIPRIISIESQPLGKDSQISDQREAIVPDLVQPSILSVQSDRSPAFTTPAEQGMTTAIGGLWYLVNVLIDLDWFSQTVPLNPWHQLWGLGQAILGDSPPDRVWNLLLDAAEDPLDTPQLDNWLQVALPVVLTHLTERLDGMDDMADISAILLEPATLYVTRTHIDVLFSLEQIRLDVRVAGLDRDPGWVPEMARVIAFHYE